MGEVGEERRGVEEWRRKKMEGGGGGGGVERLPGKTQGETFRRLPRSSLSLFLTYPLAPHSNKVFDLIVRGQKNMGLG